MKKLLLSIMLAFTFLSCETSTTTTTTGDYTPTPYYTCQYVWDTWTGNYIYACFWVYYSEDGQEEHELDLAADVADNDALILERNASIYAEKFSLSTEQAIKIAKNVKDLNALEDRSFDDIADFAQKLYGVNTTEIVSAVSKAQVGDYSEFDAVIKRSAKNFNTSSATMKAIIKELHGKALSIHGIEL